MPVDSLRRLIFDIHSFFHFFQRDIHKRKIYNPGAYALHHDRTHYYQNPTIDIYEFFSRVTHHDFWRSNPSYSIPPDNTFLLAPDSSHINLLHQHTRNDLLVYRKRLRRTESNTVRRQRAPAEFDSRVRRIAQIKPTQRPHLETD